MTDKTSTEKALWDKLEAFTFDNPDTAFQFADRLARDNGWSKTYALAVIEEYRKFLFLCAISPTGVTPSDAVDQAWHLHLTYTHSYWTELCTHTLGKALQHNPTKGGQQEAQKYTDYYAYTLDLYQQKFGTIPPVDIWPNGKQRFSDIDFTRVNKRTHWVIPKPGKKSYGLYFTIIVALLFIQPYVVPADYQRLAFSTGLFLMLGVVIAAARDKSGPDKDNRDGSGCTSGGCSSGCGGDSHGGHSGCSGCSASGCSGCSSGCSGCGGGGH
ncbi:glycine-rich domain-containing protein [Chitinophaga agrisoli]|uniref:glycine-rich domain-containing protein n=1 Tax=Chitinophaga agrisoli TaxID=2607653 RepID=UPI0016619808|nr:hypothetical protein [Chitinophaga agrisoli]